jgi:sterol desaturase/sphingolipid hydroxylase (fatty acid hydroxylase superfamily)
MSVVADIFALLNSVTLAALRNLVVLAAIFTLLPKFFWICNKTPPWWRKPDLSTDLCWTIVPNIVNRIAQTLLLIFGIIACYGVFEPTEIANFLTEGHGPLAGLGFWPQIMLYLLGSDLVMYFTHRLFHRERLWRFHAVHHSSRHLEWSSATRFHPVDSIFHGSLADVVMLLLGVPPDVLIWMMPFNVGSSALVHANLDWSFGPFRYLLASPVFHRWHHTSPSRGGSSNFAGTFALFDVLFGTFYMPAGQHPDAYGLDDPNFPADFAGQLIHPFVSPASGAARAEGRPQPRLHDPSLFDADGDRAAQRQHHPDSRPHELAEPRPPGSRSAGLRTTACAATRLGHGNLNNPDPSVDTFPSR